MCYKIFIEHEHAPSKKTKITFSSRTREKEKNHPRVLIRISKKFKISRFTLAKGNFLTLSLTILPVYFSAFVISIRQFFRSFKCWWVAFLAQNGFPDILSNFLFFFFPFLFLVSTQMGHKCIFLFRSTLLIPV